MLGRAPVPRPVSYTHLDVYKRQLVLLLLLDSGFPRGKKLVLMEAQVAQLVAFFPQELRVVVDLR